MAPLELTVVSARGLRDADWTPLGGKSDPYVVVEIVGKPHPKFTTPVRNSTTDPKWNYTCEFDQFAAGDTLKFTVYDSDPLKTDDLLGTATLACDQFYPMGLRRGEIQLENAGEGVTAFLTVTIEAAVVHPGRPMPVPVVPVTPTEPVTPIVPEVPVTRLNYQETVVDVYFCEDYAIDVEVDEKILHKVVKHVPQYVEKEVGVTVEVPEVRHTQELSVEETWITEEIPYELTTTNIREVVNPKPHTNTYTDGDERPFEVVLPMGERIIERPHVKVEEIVTFHRGKELEVEVPSSIIEVPCEVPVPRVEIVSTVEYENEIKDVVVENIQETVKIIENVDCQTVENTFEFEQDLTEITRRYVPQFVSDGFETREFIDVESLNRALMDEQAVLRRLEEEKAELRARLTQTILELSSTRQEVEDLKTESARREVELSITGSPAMSRGTVIKNRVVSGAHHLRSPSPHRLEIQKGLVRVLN